MIEGETPALKKEYALPKRAKGKSSAAIRLKSLMKRLKKAGTTSENINPADFDKLVSLKRQTRKLSKSGHDAIIKALQDKGYPILQASGEAEELCSKLCLDQHVKAVYSTDTDNIVRRCPLLITSIEWSAKHNQVVAHTVSYDVAIHERLGLDYAQFVDYCIMMGCDYNERISGMYEWNIVQLLFSHGTLEAIEKTGELDLSSLNYKECRLLFKERSLEECCVNWDELPLYFATL